MLTRLPLLFSPSHVFNSGVLDEANANAERQRRLVNVVFGAVWIFAALSTVPGLTDAGPILTWASEKWPSVFSPVISLMSQPITGFEILGCIALLTLFTCLCIAEMVGLKRFIANLQPVHPTTPVADCLRLLAEKRPAVRNYLEQVQGIRALRIGDWRTATELIGPKKPLSQ